MLLYASPSGRSGEACGSKVLIFNILTRFGCFFCRRKAEGRKQKAGRRQNYNQKANSGTREEREQGKKGNKGRKGTREEREEREQGKKGKKGNKGEKEKGRKQKAESRKRKAESGAAHRRGGGGTVTGKRIVEQGTKGTREKAGGSSSAGTVAEL